MQAVRSVASGGEFYRLPPDKENTVHTVCSYSNITMQLFGISLQMFTWKSAESPFLLTWENHIGTFSLSIWEFWKIIHQKWYLITVVNYKIRWNTLGNWVVLIFSGQKPCTRIISSILHSFLHLLPATKLM